MMSRASDIEDWRKKAADYCTLAKVESNRDTKMMLEALAKEAGAIAGDMVTEVSNELIAELGAATGPQGEPLPAIRNHSDLTGLDARLARIEERLDKHDHAIKRALAIAASFMRGDVA